MLMLMLMHELEIARHQAVATNQTHSLWAPRQDLHLRIFVLQHPLAVPADEVLLILSCKTH